MEYYIDNRQNKIEITSELEKIIESVVVESLKVEGLSQDVEVSISFVENEEIKELNREYRGIDEITDVLSFPMDSHIVVPIPLLGDIIISMEKTIEQANEFGHSINREISYLIAHSMFHLMGYDHIEEDDKKIMREKEKNIMEKINLFKN